MHEYLQAVATNDAAGHIGIDSPEFLSLITDLKRGTFPQSTYWVPLPEEYLVSLWPMGASMTATGRGHSTATPMSAAAAATVSTSMSSLMEPSRIPVPWIVNPNPDPAFTSIVVRPGGSRDMRHSHFPRTPQICI